MLFIILVLVLSIPAVQTKLGGYLTKRLNEDYKTNINVGKVGLQFNGDVELKEILIRDYKKDTLISAAELNTSILSFSNIINGTLNFGDIDMEDLIFNIVTYKGETDTNLDVFVARFDSDNPRPEKSTFLLSSSDVSIYNGLFKFIDKNKETPEILEFNKLDINATNFLINGSDVSARINTLSFIDSRGLIVQNMSTNFEYTLKNMVFNNLDIKTKNSTLKGNLTFNYNREDFKDFENKVNVDANFSDANIALDELNVFYNEFGVNQRARFSTNVSGTLNDLTLNNLKLSSSTRTKIYGDINFKNLLNSEENNFAMAGEFSNLTSNYKDLKRLLPNVLGASIPSIFDKLGDFIIQGTTDITPTKILADLNINTELGFIKSNLSISDVNSIDHATYKGNIIFDQFNIGDFLEDPKLGEISSNLDVDGFGFKKENLRTGVKGDVYTINYNNYSYKNIIVNGEYKQSVFNGKLVADDTNLKLEFNGLADLSTEINTFDFSANVEYANLNKLNFYTRDSLSLFKGNVQMKMKGTTLDDAVGNISFNKTSYKNETEDYYFEDFAITSSFEGEKHIINVNSPDIIEGTMKGEFLFKDIPDLFENSIKNVYTNQSPNIIETDQYIDFNFKIYNKIVEVFYPEIVLGKNTYIRGRVETDEKEFKLTFKSPKIEWLDYFASEIEVQVDNKNPLFNTFVEIDSLNTNFYNISKFNLINVTLNDTLYMRSEFKGGNTNTDEYNLSFYHTVNENNNSVIGFKRSDVKFKNNLWRLNEASDKYNKIEIANGFRDFNVEQLILSHKNEEIKLAGVIRDSTYKDLKLNFKDVDLAKITPRIDSLSLAGNVNGKLDLLQKNGSYLPNSSITIDDLEINKTYFGSFDANIKGNQSLTNYSVKAKIKNDTKNAFEAIGDIDVSSDNAAIDVDLRFNDFNINILSPLLEPVLSNIRGDVTGNIAVIGDLKKPNFNGDLKIDNGGLKIPYLNVDFDFDKKSSVTLDNQNFNFNTIKITDVKYGTQGILDGKISHVNFGNWRLDLGLNTNRLLVLDTKEQEESLYYGTGFISGSAEIFGPTESLNITAEAETMKGTEFYIPLSDVESFGDNSFIHFLTPEEKRAKSEGIEIETKNISGLELFFDLNVTQDALIEIVMDKESGSTIRGRGNGSLLFNINTNDKFEMFGDFVVYEGIYNFLYGGIVQKEFSVNPYESTIAWNGNPLDAEINIQAIYKTRTNPSPLLDNPINRTIPVELEINLTGKLERPEPEFKFEFPNASSTIKSELNYRLDSKADIDNQALYLITTGSFNRQLQDINLSGTIAERINGLINGIFTDSDNKIKIGLNYEAGQNRPDYNTDDRVGFTLQTKITDRVLINGKVGVPVGGASDSVIAGDVQVDFLLNEEGTLTATVFNRENSIRNFGEEIGYTQGLGIAYSVDFDTFGELLRKIFNKQETESTEATPEEKTEPTEKDNPLPEGIGIKKKQ
ncbi:translocation/assembly module TamB domain-containing protein [Lacinutrix venerupis]|uniref:N-acetyl-gamma-glutamyl-phosphate reductase n=1 Tax=Lacinutrix venerupis TaxID=1486034 RepID=A0AAC9LNL6_9FLAO|nr:translocation/assembly module TamB domain-containing protein [Lacinutrix venerupis]APY00223.1 N-acetyl-gamma-glutamyl-phosphate reductase [Lacinutrix venerupis]